MVSRQGQLPRGVPGRGGRRGRPRARLLAGAGLAGLAGLVGAESTAARPARPAAWVGPSPAGSWARTTLTVQTTALTAEPGRPGVVVAGTADGVWRSDDGGARWTRAGAGLRGKEVDALAVAPTDGALFAGGADGVVYELDAARAVWRRAGAPLDANPIYSLAVSSGGRGTVLAGTVGALYRGVATGSGWRWRWRRVARTGDAAVTSIVWPARGAQSALASVFGVWPPILATRDDGRTWRAASAGLPSALPTQALLALAPRGSRGPRVILTTMGGGVWERSSTGSGPWRDIGVGLPARHAMPLAALPGAVTTVLYVGTMGDGVYVKQGDAAWRPLGHGLTGADNTILALGMISRASGAPAALLAGTARGVFRYVVARESARRPR